MFPLPGDLPDPGVEPQPPASPALADGFFTSEPPGKPLVSEGSRVTSAVADNPRNTTYQECVSQPVCLSTLQTHGHCKGAGAAVPPRAWRERGRAGRGAARSAHKTLELLPTPCISSSDLREGPRTEVDSLFCFPKYGILPIAFVFFLIFILYWPIVRFTVMC